MAFATGGLVRSLDEEEALMKKVVLTVLFALAAAVAACAASPPLATGFVEEDGGGAPDGAAEATSPIAAPDSDATASGWTPYLRGAVAVEARGCPQCHQSTNAGDGVLSGQLSPVPGTLAFGANLTPDPETGIGRLTDDEIVRAIRAGTDEEGAHLCDAMPRFADIEDDEGAAIVAYLRGIPPVHREIPSSECGDEDAGKGQGAGEGGATNDASARETWDAASPGALNCAAYAAPTTSAACHACLSRPCQANGCFGGWYCDTSTWMCHPLPDGCK
jgi:hypothetical protein